MKRGDRILTTDGPATVLDVRHGGFVSARPDGMGCGLYHPDQIFNATPAPHLRLAVDNTGCQQAAGRAT